MRKYEVTWTEISRYRTVVMANDSVEAAEVAMREGDLETLRLGPLRGPARG